MDELLFKDSILERNQNLLREQQRCTCKSSLKSNQLTPPFTLFQVSHKEEDSTMCLRHAIRFLNQKRQKIANENSKTSGKKKILITERDFLNNWQLVYSYSIQDLESLCDKVKSRLEDGGSVVQDSVSSISAGKGQGKRKKKF